ncbi:MAG: type I pullulanase [Ruminococcus sp.]|nr:type I pullulanase [Ruminococcus sp.]
MKLRSIISSILVVMILLSSVSFAISAAEIDAAQTGYHNESYLEDYAQKAKNEQGLGVTYTKSATTFKVWSPTATAVMVKLYSTGSDAESGAKVLGTHSMKKNATTGVWSLTLDGDYKDIYYTYLLTIDGSTSETQDPYATAVGANGERSMIVDLDATDPEGWEEDEHVLFDSAAEASVWEIHVRDFSISPSSGVSDEYKGKYLAFTEGNTTVNGEGDIATCVDYLVEQGVNCVQLLPIADFSGIDETNSDPQRNWGYNPVNFNVPDGAYATDCYDGNARIKEFKQLVQALHDRGIAVVMDVVYNHTYVLEGSALARTVPKYYHRMSDAQNYYNGSGLGNCLSTEKAMTSKYVVESLKYWVEEYHIDGFRFDLMGALDCDTLNAARAELDKIDTRILMWGEPWAGGDAGIADGATNSNFSKLNDRIGGFNQTYSENLKGSESMITGTTGAFAQGDSTNAAILNAARGTATYFNTNKISKIVNYLDNHDNLTLYDKLLKTNQDDLKSKYNYTFTTNKDLERLYTINQNVVNTYYAEVSDQLRLSLLSVMTAQGIPFMNAGTEFGRTKYGDGNSYRTSDNINAIDWTRLDKWGEDADYYAGLQKIRQAFAPFSDAKADAITTVSTQNPVAYTINNTTAGQWSKALVVMNNNKTTAKSVTLPSGTWTVIANNKKAGVDSLGTATGTYSVPARSGAILVQGTYKKPAEGFATLTAEHYVRDSASGSYKLEKTNTAKYAVGQTYRAITDTDILFDHNLDKFESTTGALSGEAKANQKVTVKFYYTRFTESNYLTVNFLDSTSGERVRPFIKYRLHDGAEFSIPATGVQGYSLDTAKYPAGTVGKFDASKETTFNFYYNELTHTKTVVHFYNSHPNWNNTIIQCYAYYDTSTEEPLGKWTDNTAGNMTKDSTLGDNWYTVTIPNVKSCRVMFHPKNAVSGVQQEPGQGEAGYEVSSEAWIKDKILTFSCSVVTSYIDIATGKQLAPDVVKDYTKITSNGMYSTVAKPELGNYITPANASNFFKAGTTNVVYLYDGTQKPVDPTPGVSSLIGDVDGDDLISVVDATLVQRNVAHKNEFNENQITAADTNKSGDIEILDATNIQRYLASLKNFGHVGEKIGGTDTPVQGEHTFAELIDMYNLLSGKYVALPSDYYAEDEGYIAAGVALDTYKAVTLNPTADPEVIDEAYDAFEAAYNTIKDYEEDVEIPLPDKIDVYFTNNIGWSKVNYYCWGAANMTWPGAQMTKAYTNEMGQDVYKVTIDPDVYQNIIFNNGAGGDANQTVDIVIETSSASIGYYISDPESYGKKSVGTWNP